MTSPFPHRYGAEDRLGAVNEIGEAQVRDAGALIRSGRRYGLAQTLDAASPARMWRYWRHSLILDRVLPGRFRGPNGVASLEESVSGALHSGTHLDGLAHVGIRDHAYNGVRYDAIVGPDGLTELGMEGLPPLVTRGVLLDIAALRRVPMLGDSELITAADLEAAAARAGVEVRAGDVLVLHTGWGSLWAQDPGRYATTEPGIGIEAAIWCTDRRVAVIGADTWAVEAVPGDPPDEVFPVHQHCLARYGCYLLENVRTQELAADGVTEFCCVIAPLRLRGASASMVNPVAVV
ncbi:cyclase family protein [Baekduia soli]|uniref:Cyclase family protein n=1 Tax=Baekduia soli TaxID=496014 RepID=A0A5B8U166_9ACTN|nr:cyclase family protein [Baekduia soli]QEC46763.1 cyclase family protein [Baekduia soli]